MGLFDLFKKKKSSKTETNTRTNLDIYTKSIPLNIRKLLFISETRTTVNKNTNTYNGIKITLSSESDFEPSEIITTLPVIKGRAEPLGYYPSYYEMSPEQRYNYLTFLTNIHANIDIGYVFVYYYGLERKIFLDEDLYDAVKMIATLQKYHDNRSFISYSNDAIIYAAMKKKDPSILLNINLDTLRPELLFLVKGFFIGEFSAQDLMLLSKGVGFTNNRYIKSSPEIFQTNLAELLLKKFGSETYKLDKSITLDTHEKIRFALSNISIKNREFEYPNTLLNSDIQSDIYLLLKESHEKTKVDVANLRKSSKKTSSEHITTLKQPKKEKQSIFVPTDNLTLKERILLSKEPSADGFDEEIKGINYYKQGNYKDAEEWLLRSVKGNFDVPALYERLGILYRKQKRYNDEVEILKIGIKNVGFNSKLNERLARAIELNEKNKLK
ncbi:MULTISPECIES: TerB N-terminal domain-containing protein [unclassified Listeria]|uniref:TerB N-terminal domain-containing protein n=1 Tax=unclassified Listeria TaxID=2642072 RepID=UPI00135639CC|nr:MULTISPECIES: TerB N-terminal domain-containing protein [unclassified Listeria]